MQPGRVKSVSERGSGRDRLMATARRLFMSRGASNVGINDVTDSAGIARMTLYNNFPSKEALIFAVYEELVETTLTGLRQMDTAALSEKDRVLALFDHLEGLGHGPDYRGCPFIHASLQAAETFGPVYALAHSYKLALREHVFSLLDESRVERAELASQIVLLLDGAVTEGYLKGVPNATESAKRATVTLLTFTEQHHL